MKGFTRMENRFSVRSQLRFVQYASGRLLSRLRRRSRQPELHYG